MSGIPATEDKQELPGKIVTSTFNLLLLNQTHLTVRIEFLFQVYALGLFVVVFVVVKVIVVVT